MRAGGCELTRRHRRGSVAAAPRRRPRHRRRAVALSRSRRSQSRRSRRSADALISPAVSAGDAATSHRRPRLVVRSRDRARPAVTVHSRSAATRRSCRTTAAAQEAQGWRSGSGGNRGQEQRQKDVDGRKGATRPSPRPNSCPDRPDHPSPVAVCHGLEESPCRRAHGGRARSACPQPAGRRRRFPRKAGVPQPSPGAPRHLSGSCPCANSSVWRPVNFRFLVIVMPSCQPAFPFAALPWGARRRNARRWASVRWASPR